MRAAAGEGTAAVLVEPVIGESGVLSDARQLLRAAREACDARGRGARPRRGADGHGPDRHAVGHEQSGVVPDAMTLAKGLGRRGPRSARLVIGPGARTSSLPATTAPTFAGVPLACAAANAALDVIDDEALLARVASSASGSKHGRASFRG